MPTISGTGPLGCKIVAIKRTADELDVTDERFETTVTGTLDFEPYTITVDDITRYYVVMVVSLGGEVVNVKDWVLSV